MQVTNTSSIVASIAAQPNQPVHTAGISEQDFGKAATGKFGEILENYDLQNITPRDIDKLADQLTEAVYPFSMDMMLLRARGAEFQSHMPDFGGVPASPDEPVNLIRSVETSIEASRRHGDPTEAAQHLLDFLIKLDEAPDLILAQQGPSSVHESMYRQFVEASAA